MAIGTRERPTPAPAGHMIPRPFPFSAPPITREHMAMGFMTIIIVAMAMALVMPYFGADTATSSPAAVIASQSAPPAPSVGVAPQAQAPIAVSNSQSQGVPQNSALKTPMALELRNVRFQIEGIFSTWEGLPDPGPKFKYVVIKLSAENTSGGRNFNISPTKITLDATGHPNYAYNTPWDPPETRATDPATRRFIGKSELFSRLQPDYKNGDTIQTTNWLFRIPTEATPVALRFTASDWTDTIKLP